MCIRKTKLSDTLKCALKILVRLLGRTSSFRQFFMLRSLSLSQLGIDEQKTCITGFFQFVDNSLCCCFFFNLFAYESPQKVLGCIVFFCRSDRKPDCRSFLKPCIHVHRHVGILPKDYPTLEEQRLFYLLWLFLPAL